MMHMRHRNSSVHGVGCVVIGLALACGLAAPAAAQQDLRPGEMQTLTVTEDLPTILGYRAVTAGFLTVVVRGGSDLSISVTDDLGQLVPDGRVDSDLGGDMGAEQVTVMLTQAAEYQVRVASRSGRDQFKLAASWIAFPDVQRASDPDGRPTAAATLTPGTPIDGTLDSTAGDEWDWYSITTAADSIVTVLTEAPEGDLVLESFSGSDYGNPIDRSDQDMGGVAGNEALTIRATGGETVYVRVAMRIRSQSTVPYKLRVGVM